jgi:hypothetical protein
MPGRVRWGNVGRAAGALGAVALVVAWPRLGGGVPAVPAGEARPVEGFEARVPGRDGSRPERRRTAPVKVRDGRERRRSGRSALRRTAPVRERDGRLGSGRSARRRTAPARERNEPAGGEPVAPADEAPVAEPPEPSPPPEPPPAPPEPPPAPEPPPPPPIDPAEREFGFER